MNCKGIINILEKRNIEHLRNIIEGRYLVGSGSGCKYGAPRTTPPMVVVRVNDFFHRAPTHSLNKCTFNLTDIDGWVDTRSDVHQNISSKRLVVTS